MTQLPIHAILPELKRALSTHTRAVLQAAPGAGKTTVVPLALLDESWLVGKKIVMLEPRRLAARAAAVRMAQMLGERVGETVGYRMRGETRVSGKTRIEVVTEGVLTRLLQSDPELGGVGLVIFDEFHERSIHADLGLALSLQSQEFFCEDLRILVMSATLRAEALRQVLGDVPFVRSEGRSFSVDVRYLDIKSPIPLPDRIGEVAAKKALEALKREEGSLLLFLPGAREIRQAERWLQERVEESVIVAPLYGAMEAKAQRMAIEPAPRGKRKVVLATNIAETSLTIEGVRVVIDSGLERGVRYDVSSGLDIYETRAISQESATQRAGRAGRTAPGVCYRLWHETKALPPARKPEILTSDLSTLRLELAAWGAEPGELQWVDEPPEYALKEAQKLLIFLNMIEKSGQITPHGRKALQLGQPPRIAHMLLEAKELGLGYEGALLALWWQERPFKARSVDLRQIMEETERAVRGRKDLRKSLEKLLKRLDLESVEEHLQTAGVTTPWIPGQARNDEGCPKSPVEKPDHLHSEKAGLLTALAYPERIAKSRGERGRYVTAAGKGAKLDAQSAPAGSEYLAVGRMQTQGAEGRILEAAPISKEELYKYFGHRIESEASVRWSDETGRVEARRQERLGAVVLKSASIENPGDALIERALMDAVRQKGLAMLPWEKKSLSLLQRLRFAHAHLPDRFDDFGEARLLESLEAWLLPYLTGMRSIKDLQTLDMAEIVRGMAGWDTMQTLDGLVPERLEVPSGSKIALDYGDERKAVLPVRLQEVFGWVETPRILEGRLSVTLHLLSPAHRPLAVTEDLASFWQNVYPEVRKQMRGRYPKHYWPEDPFTAIATSKTKKGMGIRD